MIAWPDQQDPENSLSRGPGTIEHQNQYGKPTQRPKSLEEVKCNSVMHAYLGLPCFLLAFSLSSTKTRSPRHCHCRREQLEIQQLALFAYRHCHNQLAR